MLLVLPSMILCNGYLGSPEINKENKKNKS